jgi:hypothetical protein
MKEGGGLRPLAFFNESFTRTLGIRKKGFFLEKKEAKNFCLLLAGAVQPGRHRRYPKQTKVFCFLSSEKKTFSFAALW